MSYSPADERWSTWLAWQLETAGYRTLLSAWDFAPEMDFDDFVSRGVRQCTIVVAVLSRTYMAARYANGEWQAALDAGAAKVLAVRIDDCPLEWLPAGVTVLDLADVRDEDEVRSRFLDGAAQVGADRPASGGDPHSATGSFTSRRRRPLTAPDFPGNPLPDRPRTSVSILHVAGPRFGRTAPVLRTSDYPEDEPVDPEELQARIFGAVQELIDQDVPPPDLLVVSGDLTESARPSEFRSALSFLGGLRTLLRLGPDRLIVVPGNHDVSTAACAAYFSDCEANERRPQHPHFPKLAQFTRMFDELYRGLDPLVFAAGQPWTLFPIPELRVVVAGLNSTMDMTHLPDTNYGQVGTPQATWFATQLRERERQRWLRVGVVRHDPLPGDSTSPDDPDLLRDTSVVTRHLDTRLNLLLHGPGPGGTHAGQLGNNLLVLPAAGPGRAELIHITATELTRYPCDETVGRPITLTPTFVNCEAALGDQSPQAPPPSIEVPDDDPWAKPAAEEEPPARVRSPHEKLLERVAEICEIRYPTANIRKIDAEPPYLLITVREGQVIDQSQIGAHAGEVTRQVLDQFQAQQPESGSILVYSGPPPARGLREEAAADGVQVRSFTDFQGLLDLHEYLRKQSARLREDPRYPPDLYVPQRFRVLEEGSKEVRDQLVDELMDLVTSDSGKFVLLLGDFGRGKTFALRELARRIGQTAPTLIPIFIELRTLDRTRSVDTLVAAHLVNHGEERIDLGALNYMLEQGRVVLLFDGFDELLTKLSYDSAATHMSTLLQAARGKAKVVVAARTQHFQSGDQVSSALGKRFDMPPGRHILNIEDFTTDQVRAFLVNRYHDDAAAADDRMRLLRGIPDLLEMARNPRMLSFIANLDEQRLRAAAGAQRIIGPTRLYQEILTAWLTYETDRSPEQTSSLPGLSFDELQHAVTAFALRVWEAGEPYLRMDELTEVARTLVEPDDLSRLTVPQYAHALGSRSLVVRTEDNLFGFIHPSVTEWLVARQVAAELDDQITAPAPLAQAALSPLGVEFLCDLADIARLRVWAEQAIADRDGHEIARLNASRIAARLRITIDTDLRGATLSGEDLSFRNLQQVDLTDADLSGARLTGAVLDGAVLRGTRLVGAYLDQASLIGADLRDADLTEAKLIGANLQHADLRGTRLHRAQLDRASVAGADLRQADMTAARFARADLTGARGEGSRWTRAAILDVTGLPTGTDLAGSARVPGTPPDTEFAPAAIGVTYGVDTQLGRLPRPLAYSPDGGAIAIGCDYGAVVIYGTETGRTLRTLQGHRARTFAVSFTEQVVVSGSADGTVRIWDATTGEVRKILSDHDQWPWPLEVNASGDLLATGDASGTLRLRSLPDGLNRHEFPPPGGRRQRIFAIAFDGDRVAAAYHDGTVRIWEVHTGTAVGTFQAADGPLRRLVWDPTGTLLAVGGANGELGLWDSATCRLIRMLPGHRGRVHTLAFHPGEPILASGDTSGNIMLWDTGTGALLRRCEEHGAAPIHWVSFDPSGELLATGDSAGVLFVRNGRTGAPRHRLIGHAASLWPFVFRPDGGQLAVADDQFALRLWDPVGGTCSHILSGHGRHVRAVSFNADGTKLAAVGNDHTVRLWNSTTGRLIERLRGSTDGLVTLESAAFNPDQPNQLTTVGSNGRLNVLDVDAGALERRISVNAAPIWALTYDPTGRYLATANDDDTVAIWTRNTGGLHALFPDHRGRTRSIAFSADGTRMATGCDDGDIRVWEVDSGALLATLSDHSHRPSAQEKRVYGVVFHGDRVAGVSWDGKVRIWNVGGGEPLHRLTQHRGKLWCAAVEPRTGMLATAGDDRVIHLWDIASGRHLHTLTGHRNRVRSLAFDPAGGRLASGGNDGCVMVWSIGEPGPAPVLQATLLGLPEGWVACAPDGRYKAEGLTGGQFWHVIGMCRFEAGELNPYLPQIRQIGLDDPL
ncbi:pentapeptide repeat-containing protein [Nocardia sp. NPDC051030]|uniref:pentapeptide repeat-containing protein n=1 Tax=Nocardia sp. NPDC051030 TaxID=3155162 RepID=UPI003441E9EE